MVYREPSAQPFVKSRAAKDSSRAIGEHVNQGIERNGYQAPFDHPLDAAKVCVEVRP
jgi:hypothetical protein